MSWKSVDMEESLQKIGSISDGTPMFKPEPGANGKWGDNWLRILPPREDNPDSTFFHYVPVHFMGSGVPPIVCLRKAYEEFCPACQQGSGSEQKGPRWTALMNVIVLDKNGDPKDDLVRVWPCGRRTMDDLRDAIERLPKKDRDITDPATGRPVLIRRKGAGQTDTRYEVALAAEAIPLSNADELLEGLHDLTVTNEVLTVEAMEARLSGGGDPFAKVSDGRSPLRAALPAPADEEEEEEEEEEAREGAVLDAEGAVVREEPAPAPKARAKRTPKREEDAAEEQSRGKLKARLQTATAGLKAAD